MLSLSDRLQDEAQATLNEFGIEVSATGTPLQSTAPTWE